MVKPAKRFWKEAKDLLVYERGESELDFVMLLKVGGVTFACQSMGGEKTEALLEPSLAACRTLKQAP